MREDVGDRGIAGGLQVKENSVDGAASAPIDPEALRFGADPPQESASRVAPSPLEEPIGPAKAAHRLYTATERNEANGDESAAFESEEGESVTGLPITG